MIITGKQQILRIMYTRALTVLETILAIYVITVQQHRSRTPMVTGYVRRNCCSGEIYMQSDCIMRSPSFDSLMHKEE